MNLRRKQLRLKGYDYSESGYYFVTICIQDRKCILGSIIKENVGVDPSVDSKQIMKLNNAGDIVNKWLLKIEDKFDVGLDTFQIMPNHIHGIIIINRSCDGQTHGSAPTLGRIIQWFKTMATNDYVRNIENKHLPHFNKRLFQRNYYEHIIRNEKELYEIKEYIKLNPVMWEKDVDNPKNIR